MSALSSLLRQVTKKASHPNDLIYKIQLAKAKGRYLVPGAELGSGEEGEAVMLGARPEGKRDGDGDGDGDGARDGEKRELKDVRDDDGMSDGKRDLKESSQSMDESGGVEKNISGEK